MEFYTFSVTSANGYESLVAKELDALGIGHYTIGKGNVTFSGTQADGLKVCLWSRVASKVLLKLFDFDIQQEKDIYKNARKYDWPSLFDVSRTFGTENAMNNLRHTQGF